MCIHGPADLVPKAQGNVSRNPGMGTSRYNQALIRHEPHMGTPRLPEPQERKNMKHLECGKTSIPSTAPPLTTFSVRQSQKRTHAAFTSSADYKYRSPTCEQHGDIAVYLLPSPPLTALSQVLLHHSGWESPHTWDAWMCCNPCSQPRGEWRIWSYWGEYIWSNTVQLPMACMHCSFSIQISIYAKYQCIKPC